MKAPLIGVGVGLLFSATITLAQFDMFRPPEGEQQSSHGQDFQNQFRGQRQGDSRQFQGERRDGQGREFGGDDRGMMGERRGEFNEGPSEEEMKAQQQKMDERRFQDMKRGMKQFEQGLKMTQNMVKKIKPHLQKCGIGMPLELTQALDLGPQVVSKINTSKTADELEEAMSEIMDVGSAMQEWGPKMGDLSNLCEMLKRSDREFKIMTRDASKLEKRAKANKKLDLSELIAELNAQVTTMTEAWSEAKKVAKTDPKAAFEKLDDGFYSEMDNLHNIRRTIETVLDVSRGLREAKNEISRYGREIAKLKKKKVDTAQVESLLAQLKTNVDEIAQFVKTKGFDPDDLVDKVEEAFDIREELQDMLQDYGVNQGEPEFRGEKGFQFQLPQGFERRPIDNGQGQQQDQNGDDAFLNER